MWRGVITKSQEQGRLPVVRHLFVAAVVDTSRIGTRGPRNSGIRHLRHVNICYSLLYPPPGTRYKSMGSMTYIERMGQLRHRLELELG